MLATAATPPCLQALDWPNFRGPDHNGISKEQTWTAYWPPEGPKVAWKTKIGMGYSTFVVADGRVITTGHDGRKKGTDTVWCFDAAKGSLLWKHAHDAPLGDHYFDGGTTGTPTVEGQRVYHLNREGDFFCFDLLSGAIVWQRQIAGEFKFAVPEWGFASSPLVEGDLLIVNAGDAGAAFNKHTGDLVWSNGTGKCAYATAVPVTLRGVRCALILGHRDCMAIDVKTGSVIWKQPFKSKYDTSSAAPVVHDGTVLISGYADPSVKLHLADGSTDPHWNSDTSVHFNAGVVIEDHLYVFHGRAGKNEGELRCVDWKTGTVRWKQEGLGTGSLVAAPNRKLIVLGEKGELLTVEADPSAFKAHSRAQVLGGTCWTTPVLANGRLYARNAKDDMVCLDVSVERKPKLVR